MPYKRKNILFVTDGLSVGGAEKLLVEIVNRLDLSKFGISILSINPDISLSKDILPGHAELFVYLRRWRYDLSPSLKIRKLIIKNKIDIVIPFSMFEFFFTHISTIGMKSPPRAHIYIHSTVPSSRKQYLQRWVYARFLTDTDKFIAVCNTQADFWVKTYGIPREKFITIYGGVDTNYFDYSSETIPQRDIRQEYGLPSDAVIILQVAGLRDYKRQEDALSALKLLLDKSHRPIYLLFLGTGTDERLLRLKNMAAYLELSKKVVFCGQQKDVRPYLRAADLFTLTSSSGETFSIAALEAMAMGVPCVLTDTGGAREMIVDGMNGSLVEPGNPESIAAGWLKAINQAGLFDHEQIRKYVIDRFNIQKLIINFEDTLSKTD